MHKHDGFDKPPTRTPDYGTPDPQRKRRTALTVVGVLMCLFGINFVLIVVVSALLLSKSTPTPFYADEFIAENAWYIAGALLLPTGMTVLLFNRRRR